MQPASAPSLAAFLAIVVAVIVAFLFATRRAGGPTGRLAAGILVWLGALSAFVASGFPQANPLPALPIFFVACQAAGLALALSPLGKRLAVATPVAALVAFQAFRLPLELVLHSWSTQGVIPSSMTWSGQNLDIISGLTAFVLAPFAGRRRRIAWIANGVGFVLLLNVMRVALFSSPIPIGWDVEPKLLLAYHLPYMWIVPVCVAGALAGHVILTRHLLLVKSP